MTPEFSAQYSGGWTAVTTNTRAVLCAASSSAKSSAIRAGSDPSTPTTTRLSPLMASSCVVVRVCVAPPVPGSNCMTGHRHGPSS